MAKAELKTKMTEASVDAFIDAQANEQLREDCWAIADLMAKATKSPPKMWGTSIVGFGNVQLKYVTGRELDWMLCGFSPRKANLTVYLCGGLEGHKDLLAKLGKHSLGKGCLYIKRVSDVDMKVLKALITASLKDLKEMTKDKNQDK